MAERMVALDLPPGLSSNGTPYQNRNRWIDSSLVRFQDGAIRPVGGWALNLDAAGADLHVVGKPRDSLGWRDNSGNAWLGVGTTGTPSKLYALSNLGVLTDITPAGLVDGAADGYSQIGGPFGSGLFGGGLYGGSAFVSITIPPDTWQIDNFGQLPVFCLTSDGKLYSWDLNVANDAVQITNSPSSCRALVVTPERFLFALGAGGDPRLVQWCARESLTTWTAGPSNNAGDQPLQTDGRIICGRAANRETLIWTDSDLWGAVFIGGDLVYGFTQRGDSCGIAGPNAVAIVDGVAYWMGDGQFFQYAGAVRPLPCAVRDAVFGDMSATQQAKVQAIAIAEFKEVWWFYASADQDGTENDKAVALNYETGEWMLHDLARAAGVGAGVFTSPQLWTSDGYLYTHEFGTDHGGDVPFIESGPLEIGDGERTTLLSRLYPDELELGSLRGKVYSAYYPTDVERESAVFNLTAPTNLRVSGRQFRLRFEENTASAALADGSSDGDGDTLAGDQTTGRDWRLGRMRVGVIPQGAR